MDALALGGIALGLAMDAFAVSVGLGLCGSEAPARRACRIAAHFGAFQSGMTLAGYATGWAASGALHEASHWVAASILWLVGAHMLASTVFGRREDPPGAAACERAPSGPDSGRGWPLLVLAVATSIDAFGVGMGLGFLGARVWLAAAVIGFVAAALSALGVSLACRIASATGAAASRAAEVAGALVLLGIGAKIALEALA